MMPHVDEIDETEIDETLPRRRLTQAEAKERTRKQLLAAAARVFAQKGFGGASLEEIAELAGYTTGALYYNFSGKEQLFLELLSTSMSREIANRVEAVTRVFSEDAAGGGDPFEALSGFVAERAGRSREFAPLSAEFWLYAVRNPAAMDLIATKFGEQERGLEPVIAAAMERFGALPEISATEMTMVAVSLFRSLVQRRHIDPAAVPDDLFARVLRRLFVGSAEPANTSLPPA
jgi:AcrR family transcriptional regulator